MLPRTHGDTEFGGEFGLLKGDAPLRSPIRMSTTQLSHPGLYRPAHPEDEVTAILAEVRGKPASTPGFLTAFSR